jgi:hypothetical protein
VPPVAVIGLRKKREVPPAYADPVFMIARRDLDDMAEHREPADRTDRIEPKEPIEKAERNDPTEPIDRADPIEPIDMNDPRLPIDRTEFSDHSDQRERVVLEAMPQSCLSMEAALTPAPGDTVALGLPLSPRGVV